MGDKTKAYDFLQDDFTSEKAQKEREKESKEPYKKVRANVKKDDGRGEGYVDRIGDGDDDALLVVSTEEKEENASLSKGERSHLIVWEVCSPEQEGYLS